MYRHILLPTDGSPLSSAAVEKGLAFAKAVGARVTVLSVLQPFHVFTVDANQLESTRMEYERKAPQQVERYLAEAASKAKMLNVPCDTLKVWDEHPYRAIIDTAVRETQLCRMLMRSEVISRSIVSTPSSQSGRLSTLTSV